MSISTHSFLRLSNATGIRRFGEHLTWIQEPDIFHMRLVGTLEASANDVLYDDRRTVSPGVKFGDAELLGVPVIAIVGRDAVDGFVELWDRRSGDRTKVALADVVSSIAALA